MIASNPLSAIYLTGMAASLASCRGPSDLTKTKIIILFAHDMGWDYINANGNKQIETPVLNRLKSQSLSFERFYVCPLSTQARAEMLTDKYFLRTCVSSVTRSYENMRTDEVTIAEILKTNGYTTGSFGKWLNGGYYQQHPNRQGFDEYLEFCIEYLDYYFDAFYLDRMMFSDQRVIS